MKVKILFIISLCVIFASAPAFPATITVSPGQSIQEAINAAQNGDTILVNAGTYIENLNFKGKQITVQSTAGASATIIDGGGVCHVVTFSSGEQREAVIQGFTIRNGVGKKLDGLDYGFGGGILCRGSSPIIRGNIIEQNKADNSTSGLFGLGGGICVYEGSYPEIVGNTIRNNTAESGAGIYIFTTNDPEETSSTQTIIQNNNITSNNAQLGGAIFICGNSHPKIINNTLSGNTQIAGDAIYICSDSSADISTLITLSKFEAKSVLSSIIIMWTTSSELDNAGFNLYRAVADNGEYEKINDALIPAKGSATQGAQYEFIDKNVRLWKTYYYKLEDVDLHGVSSMHGPLSATVGLHR